MTIGLIVAGAIVLVFFLLVYYRPHDDQLISYYSKGSKIENNNQYYIKCVQNRDKNIPFDKLIKINDTPISFQEENKNFFFVGQPGTGKTLSFFNIGDCIKKRNNKKIIYDFKGDYIPKLYDEKIDYIFNPLDNRSLNWNIFNEIVGTETEQKIIIEHVAGSIIPEFTGHSGNNDKFWRDGAREVLISILNFLRLENKKTNNDIHNMLSSSPSNLESAFNQYKICQDAIKFITPVDSPQTAGIMATLTQFTKFFRYLDNNNESTFSIKKWINSDEYNTIFISNYASMQEVLKPILTLFIDLLSSNILSLKDNIQNRIYLLIDELGTLQPLSSLIKLLSLGRSKGASVWLAIQDFSQIDQLYGEYMRKTIINSCNTHAYFSVADSSTALEISNLIGEQEVLEESRTKNHHVFDMNPNNYSKTLSKIKKQAIMPSEVMQLKPFQFIFKSNICHPFYARLNPADFAKYPNKAEHFIIK